MSYKMKTMKIPETIIVEHFGNDHLEPILPICDFCPAGNIKPLGGLWTSPINSVNSWREWCERENFSTERLKKSFRIEISTEHLLVIDSYDDFKQKMLDPYTTRISLYNITFFDMKELPKQYDGIWLTARGEYETRFSQPYNLYGWDCETVLLFNEKPIIRVL